MIGYSNNIVFSELPQARVIREESEILSKLLEKFGIDRIVNKIVVLVFIVIQILP